MEANIQLKLKKFLKENYHENLNLLSADNYDTVKRPLLVVFHCFYDKFVELKAWTQLLYEISKQFPANAIQFAVADFENLSTFHANWHDLDYFGFEADMPPYIYAVDALQHQFQYAGNVSYDGLVEYAKNLIANKLWRTQPITAETGETALPNLKTVVASNFDKSVFENDKDVLVTFHSNYTFTHEYNLMDVPRELKDDSENLVFYNYNAEVNYLPLEYKIRELPTSMLIRSSDKSKRLFFEHCKNHPNCSYACYLFRRFVAANVTNELKYYDRNGKQKDIEAINQKALVEYLKENYGEVVKTFLSCQYCNQGFPMLVFFHHYNAQFLELKDSFDLLRDLKKHFSDLSFRVADFDKATIFHMKLDEMDLFALDSFAPAFVFAVDAFGRQFQYDGELTLYKYCEALASNNLYKTEFINDQRAVEVCDKVNKLTADNFWSLTLSHEKDVLVTFYKNSLTWEATVNEVIKALKCDLDKLVFYKYNVEENTLPLELQMNQFPASTQFPTSMLFLRVDKFRKLYFNHASHLHPYHEDLIAFLAKNTSTELTFWNRKGQRRVVEELTIETD